MTLIPFISQLFSWIYSGKKGIKMSEPVPSTFRRSCRMSYIMASFRQRNSPSWIPEITLKSFTRQSYGWAETYIHFRRLSSMNGHYRQNSPPLDASISWNLQEHFLAPPYREGRFRIEFNREALLKFCRRQTHLRRTAQLFFLNTKIYVKYALSLVAMAGRKTYRKHFFFLSPRFSQRNRVWIQKAQLNNGNNCCNKILNTVEHILKNYTFESIH